ncbi:unnamed protein product, partial [Dovyalis caffra]
SKASKREQQTNSNRKQAKWIDDRKKPSRRFVLATSGKLETKRKREPKETKPTKRKKGGQMNLLRKGKTMEDSTNEPFNKMMTKQETGKK